jgi:hypothetical protein
MAATGKIGSGTSRAENYSPAGTSAMVFRKPIASDQSFRSAGLPDNFPQQNAAKAAVRFLFPNGLCRSLSNHRVNTTFFGIAAERLRRSR